MEFSNLWNILLSEKRKLDSAVKIKTCKSCWKDDTMCFCDFSYTLIVPMRVCIYYLYHYCGNTVFLNILYLPWREKCSLKQKQQVRTWLVIVTFYNGCAAQSYNQRFSLEGGEYERHKNLQNTKQKDLSCERLIALE